MSVQHKPAAAWSRDSLTAWEYMATDCTRNEGTATAPKHAHVEFLRRWAAKILVLVNDEMGFCDWYWFLARYFETKLKQMDPHVGPVRDLEFRGGNFEPDRHEVATEPTDAR